MNERVVPKMINSRVVKLSNSPAITCVPRLELDHFESQSDSPRINQRFLSLFRTRLLISLAVGMDDQMLSNDLLACGFDRAA
jgi:hypothetical protein